MRHYHSHQNDYSTNIKFPENINVHEHKAPTDESIRLMEEMHDKAMKNIIAKVKVDDNLISGHCFACEQPWNIKSLRLIFKFKINGQEFTIEKELDRCDLLDDHKDISNFQAKLKDYTNSVMLWYALRKFSQIAYEQITKEKLPDHFIK